MEELIQSAIGTGIIILIIYKIIKHIDIKYVDYRAELQQKAKEQIKSNMPPDIKSESQIQDAHEYLNQVGQQAPIYNRQPIGGPAGQQGIYTPYVPQNFLLTLREAEFYKILKPITDKYNLVIFCKMRIADIVKIPPYTRNWNYWFTRISQKHIDFILCDKHFVPKILIEVDDTTHDTSERIKSDQFKNAIFRNAKMHLLRYRNWDTELLEREIYYCLFGTMPVKNDVKID